MRIKVMKFGGTSVRTPEARMMAALRVISAKEQGFFPVVVVSASKMGSAASGSAWSSRRWPSASRARGSSVIGRALSQTTVDRREMAPRRSNARPPDRDAAAPTWASERV